MREDKMYGDWGTTLKCKCWNPRRKREKMRQKQYVNR